MDSEYFDVVIVGGGAAGICVAAKLSKILVSGSIAIIEPSTKHYYQPLWTLVGGGITSKSQSKKMEASLIPKGVAWICDGATNIDPELQIVSLRSQAKVHYQHLIIATGFECYWDKIEGLTQTLGKNGVCSNYSYKTVDYTWECIRTLKSGRAIFTFPATAVKCGGAPQKIMYLADSCFRKHHVRSQVEIDYRTAGAAIFPVKHYADVLMQITQKRSLNVLFKNELVAVDGPGKRAAFRTDDGKTTWVGFDLLHVTPPMGPHEFIRKSLLASTDGFVDVNIETLQHKKFKNVFALGDVAGLPTSKTAAAVRKQVPVLVSNFMAYRKRELLPMSYNGYTSCPIVTDYNKLILAEFGYDGKLMETFPFDQSKERFSMFLLKKHVLPELYWNGMLKGIC